MLVAPRRLLRQSASVLAWGGSAGVILLLGCATPSAAERRVFAAEEKMRDAGDADKLLARGRAFYRIGDFTRAIQYFTDAIDAGADEAVAAPPLMLAYVESGQYRSAIQFGQDALNRRPDDYRLHYLVASLMTAIANHEGAVSHLRSVVRLNPSFADAHYALGVIYRDHNRDLVLADEHFRAYLALSPTGSHAEEAKATLLRSVP